MNISRMIIMTLILGLLGQLYAYAEKPLKLEAKEGFYQFPFFDRQTPVWAYNGRIPGPLIRSKVDTTLVIDFINGLKEPSSIHWHGSN
jgi:FtsP/CotA-like multicopper oxidase with cupredoxin domain